MTATVPKWEIDTENHVGVAVFQGNPNTLGALLPKGYLGIDAADGELWQTTDGAGTWVQMSFAGGSYLLLTGGTVTGQLNVSGTIAGDYIMTIRQSSATGYGLFLKPGSDTLGAFAVANAANTATNIILYGSGIALFYGTVSGIAPSSGSSITFQTYIAGDGYARGYWRADGALFFGPGSATADSYIYRIGVSALRTPGSWTSDGYLQAIDAFYAGSYGGSARAAGTITTRTASGTGALYFGDGNSAYLAYNGTSYYLGAGSGNASFGVQGQVRATGWYQAGDLSGFACEIGVSSSVAYLISYDRTAGSFQPLGIEASSITMNVSGFNVVLTSSAFTFGGIQVATIAWGSSAPTSSTPGIVGTLFGVT